jgi:hypothetical protein
MPGGQHSNVHAILYEVEITPIRQTLFRGLQPPCGVAKVIAGPFGRVQARPATLELRAAEASAHGNTATWPLALSWQNRGFACSVQMTAVACCINASITE